MLNPKMNKNKTTIEILAIGRDAVYSIGKVDISKSGDVYLIHKIKNANLHTSRHRDGQLHTKLNNQILANHGKTRIPVEKFDGLEFLQTMAFGLDSLSELHKEYKPKKSNSIVAINMINYENLSFNLGIWILTENGIANFHKAYQNMENRQVYICASSKPMIGFIFGNVSNKKV